MSDKFTNIITIIIQDGIVQEVQGLPENYNYQVADMDITECCFCKEHGWTPEPFEWEGQTLCLTCNGEIEKEFS